MKLLKSNKEKTTKEFFTAEAALSNNLYNVLNGIININKKRTSLL